MPTPEEQMFEIDEALQAAGLPEMTAEIMKEVWKLIQEPEAQEKLSSGEITPQFIAEQVKAALEAQGQGGEGQQQPPMGQMMPPPQQSAPVGGLY